jgi:uncharacterized protein YbaR (Trm112 family)
MIKPELLKILCCPETHQRLTQLGPAQVDEINGRIASGKLVDRLGTVVTEGIEGGFIREDGKVFYPIRRNIPVLLIKEGIQL